MDNAKIKDNIRKIRKSRGLTQEEMADRLGMSLTAYRELEKGATAIFNSNISKIAALTGTSAEEIVLGHSPENINGILEEDRTGYGYMYESLQTRVRYLEKLVESLEEVIEGKNEIISLLKKSISESV